MADAPVVSEADLRAMEDPAVRQQGQEANEEAARRAAAANAILSTPAPAPAPPPAAAPAPAATTPEQNAAELETLYHKAVELGQDLTPQEQARVAELEKLVPEPPPDVKYRIAGQEITYADAAAKARADIGIGNVDLAREAEQKLVETWVTAQNKSEQSKAAEQRSQVAAHQQQAVTDQEVIAAQRMVVDAQNKVAQTTQDLERRRADLQSIIEEIQDNETIMARRPTPAEIDNGLDFRRQADLVRAEDAEMRISRLRAKGGALQQTITQEEAALQTAQGAVSAAENRATFLNIASVVATTARELQPTSCSLVDAIGKYFHKEELPDEDWERMHTLAKILTESDVTGQPIEKVYRSMKRNGQLTVKGAQTSNAGRELPPPLVKGEELINKIQKLRDRVSAAPARLPAGQRGQPAGPGGQLTPEQAALRHIESERVGESTPRVDPSVFEGKITIPQRAAGA
jgi:hypothetical protein